MRSTARVTIGDQVWSVREDAAARWSIVVGGLPRPLPADAVDLAAPMPTWHDGERIPGCVRWATPDDLARLDVAAQRIGGGRS
jgi:hypothetical protein